MSVLGNGRIFYIHPNEFSRTVVIPENSSQTMASNIKNYQEYNIFLGGKVKLKSITAHLLTINSLVIAFASINGHSKTIKPH